MLDGKNDTNTIKMELKTQLKNERDKVTEEIRKRIAIKERGEKEGKALRDKLDDQQKHFAKEKQQSDLTHEKLLAQVRRDLNEQKGANSKLIDKCRSMEEKFLHHTKNISLKKEKQIAFKKRFR